MFGIAEFKLRSRASLLMHNERLANPLDSYCRELKRLSAKRNKSDDDLAQLARAEFLGGIYCSDEGPYLPAKQFRGSLIAAGKSRRLGTHVKRGIISVSDGVLEYEGPRDPDALFDAGWFDQRMVVVSKKRILRTRPRFDEWLTTVKVEFLLAEINPEDLSELMSIAGFRCGIGDYRPQFGRFTVEGVIHAEQSLPN